MCDLIFVFDVSFFFTVPDVLPCEVCHSTASPGFSALLTGKIRLRGGAGRYNRTGSALCAGIQPRRSFGNAA